MLFELIVDPDGPGKRSLGYHFIEVLAIVPYELADPGKDDEEGCWKVFRNHYVCNTEDGLARIKEEDLWRAVDGREYLVMIQPAAPGPGGSREAG